MRLNLKFFWILLFLLVLPALACNLPQAAPEPIEPGPAVPDQENYDPGPLPDPPLPAPVEHPPDPTLPPAPTPAEPDPGPVIPSPIPPVELPVYVPGGLLPPSLLDGYEEIFTYQAQSGDSLPSLAARFEVETWEITSSEEIPAAALLRPGQTLFIPNRIGPVAFYVPIFPDSEVVYSPTASDFDLYQYVSQAGGYLSGYREVVDGQELSGVEIVRLIAVETSTNPLLLLAVLEQRAGWVRGLPFSAEREVLPIGFYVPGYTGLYKELSLTAKMLGMGYYGWRSGDLRNLEFPQRITVRFAPGLNAGSAAVQYLYSKFHRPDEWQNALYGPEGLAALYAEMFGDPWTRASLVEPILPVTLSQPVMELPFLPGERWALTAGPHQTWLSGTPRGALDFAPVTGEPRCAISRASVTASAPGVVVRSERGALVLDLDGDGRENTGWAILYMHLADQGRLPVGSVVAADQHLGHPSCEGGVTTGTHVHIARKYNGEWIKAEGAVPFVLSGWVAYPSERPYEGILVKGDQVVTARPDGSRSSSIFRD
jgi:LasA protease